MRRVGFGTDGWRGVIADGFTMENLGIVTQAVMSYLKAGGGRKDIYISYDTRFMSREAALLSASVAAGNGFRVRVSNSPMTSPMLAHAVHCNPCSGGLMITASHNPYQYNGLKFKPPYGGSAHPGITSKIESLIGAGPVSMLPYNEALKRGIVSEEDFFPAYGRRLREMVDAEAIRHGAPDAVFDCMHGAAGPYAGRLWDGLGLELRTIRSSRDPYFGGCAPEPSEANLSLLSRTVVEGGYGVGFAADGDGDRLGVVGPSGRYLPPHVVLCLLMTHLRRKKGNSGSVVKTVSTSSLVDRVAADLGLPVIETPVGFKHICGVMLEKDVLIGGEENGGIGVKGFIPERDGLLSSLLVMEMLADAGKDIENLADGLDEKYGKLYYRRYDVFSDSLADRGAFEGFGEGLGRLFGAFGNPVITRLDGFKAVFADGSWILFRLSGTEPLVRVYAESDDPGRAGMLVERAKEALLG